MGDGVDLSKPDLEDAEDNSGCLGWLGCMGWVLLICIFVLGAASLIAGGVSLLTHDTSRRTRCRSEGASRSRSTAGHTSSRGRTARWWGPFR